MSMVESIMRQAQRHLERLDARRRETVPASELVVGVQCGGSDAFSGVTANPAVGFCADLLVRAGASVMFSETTEVRDGIAQLTARAASPDVAQAMIREMAWYDACLERGSADRSATIEQVGWELFHLMLDVASGRRKTWAEHWKLHNALVLFNPAPVT